MDYQWIFCLIHLLLYTNIELLRMKEIMLFDIFQHMTKNQNLNQNGYANYDIMDKNLSFGMGRRSKGFLYIELFQI